MLYDAGTRYFIPKRIAMLSMVAALSALLSACHSLPSSELSPHSTHRHSHTLSAGMPLIDSQGRIAYIEEQGTGKAKISRLYSIRPDGSKRQLIDQIKGYIYAPSWSADGKRLAYSKQALRQQPKIYIYDSASRSSRLIVDAPGSHLSPSFSPDGQKLLYSSTVDGDADIYELNLSDGHTRQLTTLPSTEVQPSYANDGQSFVYTSDKVRANHPRLYRYRFATAKATRIPTAGYAASAQLSLDGQHMGYLNGQSAAIMNVTSGQVIALSNTGLDEPARLSPSGRYAIYPTRNAQGVGSLVVHSLSDHTSYSISSQAGGVVRSPVWGR